MISTFGFGREKPWLSFPPERLGPGQRRALRCGAVSMDLQAACEVEMGMVSAQPWLPYRTAMTWHGWIFSPMKIWVNLIATSLFDRTLESWLVREIIPFYGRKIQVSEILLLTQIKMVTWGVL